jgi:hypothetical protein
MLLTEGDRRPFNSSRGVRLALKRSFAGPVESVVGYTYGTGIRANRGFSELTPQNYHVVAARVKSAIPVAHTQFAATYRWISGDSLTIIDPYQDVFDSASPGISLMFAQALPYFGRFIPGRLEAEVELRNLLASGNSDFFKPDFYESATLRRVEFLQPARSVRGGIKLKF